MINFNFAKYKSLFLIFSFVLIVFSIIILLKKGFNYGLDFAGGFESEILISSTNNSDAQFMYTNIVADLQKSINNNKNLNIIVKKSNDNVNDEESIAIKLIGKINSNVFKDIFFNINNNFNLDDESLNNIKLKIDDYFKKNQLKYNYLKFNFVGPEVSGGLIKSGILAIITAMILMFLYLFYRFWFNLAIGGLAALIHDVIVTCGIISFFSIEFNLQTVAALLTIIGYSINDTVVIYDRIREISFNNFNKLRKNSDEIINKSINSTLKRTILTVFTTIISLICLIIFAGEAIRSFSLTALTGILIGTYSSICVAPYFRIFSFDNSKLLSTKNAF